MKMTRNFYDLLCNRYLKIINDNTNNIASEIEQLVNKKNKEHTILDKIYTISEAKDKLESLRDFWRHNGSNK
tara:strand:+ start:14031 stop:14246 length:216 start_codon:yes stop_codon:yes gene_type:complete